MTTYKLPKEPSGPVWDKEGNEWRKSSHLARYWTRGNRHMHWGVLLDDGGPLSDVPPVKVGDTITLEEFSKLPRHSIAGGNIHAYILHLDGIRATYGSDILDFDAVSGLEVTLLRIGDGSQS